MIHKEPRREDKSNRNKLHQEKLHLNIRNIVTVSTIWNNLPWYVVESPSQEIFKMQLDKVLDNLI